MKDEGYEQLRLARQSHESVPNVLAEFMDIRGCEVAQLAILGPTPDVFVGVGVRGVCREVLHDHLGVPGQPLLDHLRPAVDLAAVPDDRPWPTYLALELSEEQHHLFAMEVLV